MFYTKVDSIIELKTLEESQAGELFALIDKNRIYLKKHLPWVDGSKSVEDTKQFIVETHKKYSNSKDMCVGIFISSKIVGVISTHEIDWSNKRTALGYWLSKDLQGKGIITKCCRALINYLFDEYKLNKIEIHCATDNPKSQAVPKRLEFKQEGVIRDAQWLYDHYTDLVIFGMLAQEWVKKDRKEKKER